MSRKNSFFVSVLAVILLTVNLSAQNPSGWMERMRMERIGYLTAAMGLTQEEAQKFWPIYNEAEKERNEAMAASFNSYNELNKAVKSGKDAKEISDLFDKYNKAQQAINDVEQKYLSQYKRLLSIEKVAKLYIAEEDFRRMQINRLQIPSHNAMGPNPGNKNKDHRNK